MVDALRDERQAVHIRQDIGCPTFAVDANVAVTETLYRHPVVGRATAPVQYAKRASPFGEYRELSRTDASCDGALVASVRRLLPRRTTSLLLQQWEHEFAGDRTRDERT